VSAPATSVDDGLGTLSISKKDKKKEKRRVLLKCADEEVRVYDYQSEDFDGRITFLILQFRCFKSAASFVPEGHRQPSFSSSDGQLCQNEHRDLVPLSTSLPNMAIR
jgi:hypothetical protein